MTQQQDANITPRSDRYEVRFTAFSKQYTKAFAFKVWGGESKAHAAASAYRDSMRARLGMMEEPSESNIGIQCIHFLTVTWRGRSYIAYRVYYKSQCKNARRVNGVRHRDFYVCLEGETVPTMSYMHAFLAAKRFRQIYMLCIENNIPFHPTSYLRRWQNKPIEYFTTTRLQVYENGIIA